jgi:aminoglycoside 6'-N-acetyltransferase
MTMPEVLRPRLVGSLATVRPGRREDVGALCAILAEPSVMRWWGEPERPDEVAAKLLGDGADAESVLLVIEADGAVAGGIEYYEERDPMYRHAGIDVYLSEPYQGRGVGTDVVGMVVRFLVEGRGHHRVTIDPATANTGAIRCYEKVGFRPVGVMRRYERGLDGTFHDGLLMDLLAEEISPARRAGTR